MCPGTWRLWKTTKQTIYVATIFDNEWGSGLNLSGTANTKQSKWPGKNLLGTMIQNIAIKCRKRKFSDQWSRGKQKSGLRDKSKQRDIVQMLQTCFVIDSIGSNWTGIFIGNAWRLLVCKVWGNITFIATLADVIIYFWYTVFYHLTCVIIFMASPLQLAVGPRPSQGGLFTNF